MAEEQKKVYVVRYGCYSDQGIAGAFSTEEKAQRYCDIRNKIDKYYGDFWVDAYIIDENEHPADTRVEKYYNVCINLEEGLYKAGEIYIKDEGYKIYTTPVVIEKHDNDYIYVASTTSLEHAKKVAIEQYQIYTQQKLEEAIMENK